VLQGFERRARSRFPDLLPTRGDDFTQAGSR